MSLFTCSPRLPRLVEASAKRGRVGAGPVRQVYELYGLTEEEVKIVEASLK